VAAVLPAAAAAGLAAGVHAVRFVVLGDLTCAAASVHVLPRPHTPCVVFAINSALAVDHTLSGGGARLRPHAPQLAQFYAKHGFTLIYLTGRPRYQRPAVEAWMSRLLQSPLFYLNKPN